MPQEVEAPAGSFGVGKEAGERQVGPVHGLDGPDPTATAIRVRLPRDVWNARAAAHEARVGPVARDWLARRSLGRTHPVWDFLFTYYSFPAGRLLTWVPGLPGLEPDRADDTLLSAPDDPAWEAPRLAPRVRELARWVAELGRNLLERPARFHCHALHEWAMVYGQTAEEVRHRGWRLRLAPEALRQLVESQSLVCTHYDAFRFFTPQARPLNQFAPTREDRLASEQAGCLHANMDLYKWAYKLWPWIGSDLVGEAFALAVTGRIVDMRSSPYDLHALGFPPIAIETEAGREEFRQEQQRLAEAAQALRARLTRAAMTLADTPA